jgi:hypothetical protein
MQEQKIALSVEMMKGHVAEWAESDREPKQTDHVDVQWQCTELMREGTILVWGTCRKLPRDRNLVRGIPEYSLIYFQLIFN